MNDVLTFFGPIGPLARGIKRLPELNGAPLNGLRSLTLYIEANQLVRATIEIEAIVVRFDGTPEFASERETIDGVIVETKGTDK